jgi:hypothetical protein
MALEDWIKNLAVSARHSGDPKAALQIFVTTMNEARALGAPVWLALAADLGSTEGTLEMAALAYLEFAAKKEEQK